MPVDAPWLKDADEEMIHVLEVEAVPTDLAACWPDQRPQGWRAMLGRYLKASLADENFNFLNAVERYRAQNGDKAALALQLYDDYVRPEVVNIPYSQRQELVKVFENPAGPPTQEQIDGAAPEGKPDLFEDARYEIWLLVSADNFPRFRKEAARVKTALVRDLATPVKPNAKEVDDWNETALKALREGQKTQFFQVEDLVIIANPAKGSPPGLSWAQGQAAVVGQITMTEKGGALSRGSIMATGVQAERAFEEAIARFSKKEVNFGKEPEQPTEPRKASTFARKPPPPAEPREATASPTKPPQPAEPRKASAFPRKASALVRKASDVPRKPEGGPS